MSIIEPDISGQGYKIRSIYELSPNALGELRSYMESSGFQLPISQVVGFSQFTAKSDVNNGAAYRDTNTYGDPTTGTAGPTVGQLSRGKYLLLYGALAWDYSGGGGTTYVAPSVNGAAAVPADAISTTANSHGISIMRAVLADLLLDVNEVQLKYNMSAGTGRWDNRFLICLRYANQ